MNNLPLAEKTDIRKWDFNNLKLQATESEPVIQYNDLIPCGAKNAIVLNDGKIVYNSIKDSINISTDAEISVKTNNCLVDLNNENKNSVLKVEMGKNAVLSEPLYIIYLASNRSLVHQTEINLKEGAELELVETFLGDSAYNANIISSVNVGSNAKFNSSVINRLSNQSAMYYHRTTNVNQDGKLTSCNFIINTSNMVFEDFSYLIGKGAEASVSTVSVASGSSKQNATVRVENLAPFSNGNIVNYGIVKDMAHLAFNGIGKIHKGKNGGDNQQETRMLNLSKTSEAVANPFLLIDEGDITAGHAASIGQINEEQVYYLMTRGMNRAESEKLIASGFLTPFVNSVGNTELKKELLNLISEKLG